MRIVQRCGRCAEDISRARERYALKARPGSITLGTSIELDSPASTAARGCGGTAIGVRCRRLAVRTFAIERVHHAPKRPHLAYQIDGKEAG
jgi:hypothetical protein